MSKCPLPGRRSVGLNDHFAGEAALASMVTNSHSVTSLTAVAVSTSLAAAQLKSSAMTAEDVSDQADVGGSSQCRKAAVGHRMSKSIWVRHAGLAGAVAFLILAIPASAQGDKGAGVDWVTLAMGALGGLALFLYGVEILASSLKEAQGGRFQKLLERSAANRVLALAGGTAATIALDSSSVVIILLITLVDAGLMPFANALPAILGANIGTTFSSQLFAWNIDTYAPVPIAAGLLWKALTKSKKAKRNAKILLGLGLVLFGLNIIGTAAEPLQEHPGIIAWLKQLENPFLGVLAGALVTIAIQSSSAMMGIVITLAGGGIITLPAGIAIMLGAEIGTCADTLLATIGRSRAAVKLGIFHLLFNAASVGIGVLLIDQLAQFGAATAQDTGQRIANAHVLFNVAGALLILPFVGRAAKLLGRIVPERRDRADDPMPSAQVA